MIFHTEFSSSRVRPFLKSAVEPMNTGAPRLVCVLSREHGETKAENATVNESTMTRQGEGELQGSPRNSFGREPASAPDPAPARTRIPAPGATTS